MAGRGAPAGAARATAARLSARLPRGRAAVGGVAVAALFLVLVTMRESHVISTSVVVGADNERTVNDLRATGGAVASSTSGADDSGADGRNAAGSTSDEELATTAAAVAGPSQRTHQSATNIGNAKSPNVLAKGKQRGVRSFTFPNGAANQAAPISAAPLLQGHRTREYAGGSDGGGGGAGAFAATSAAARCWDRNGDPTAVPKWVVALFALFKSEADYRAVAAAADGDPWALLVAWVPSRFMPPQRDGKNAAGQPIKAPTRGRDPDFYLREYNASWHATATVAGLPYHYQLLHRNALAVCIRERLHTEAVRCAPSGSTGLPTALLYHCVCRKCVPATAHQTPKSVGKAPEFDLSQPGKPLLLPAALARTLPAVLLNPPPPMKTPSAKEAPARYDGKCVQALSAPWLVDQGTVASFKYEGLDTNLDRLLSVQADTRKIVMVAMFNKFWIDHLHNFYFSMVRRAALENIIVATLDPEALAVCKQNRLPCFDAADFAELEEDMVEGGAGYLLGHKRKVTEAMSWIKPRLAVAILERGYGFFMVDLDMSYNAWPMADVLAAGTDLAHQCDSESRSSINSGYYLARPNVRTWSFFRNLMVFRPEENSDQTAMKLFSRYDHTHGMSNACLDKWAFNMKCNYKKAGSVKRTSSGGETFEWAAFDRNQTKFFWKILHATCISGAQAKLLYLRTMNAWFLDDLDKLTTPGPYCLALPDGSESPGHTAVTQHSSKYTTETDPRFLEPRH